MATGQIEQTVERLPGVLLRVFGAALAVLIYILARGSLSPQALVAARFGLGVLFFALLVDIGRALAGRAEPLTGQLSPHRQQADPLVDDAYRRVHRAMERYVDEGIWTAQYRDMLEVALANRGIPSPQRDRLLAQARQAAEREPPGHRPVTVALVSGLVVIAGLDVILGLLLTNVGAPLTGPLLALTGAGVWVLQFRAARAGQRWVTLGVGLTGATLTFIGGLRMVALHGAAFRLVQFGSAGLAVGTVALVALASFRPPPWTRVEEELEDELATLRRAFLATLLAGIVLFPFKPLIGALFAALGWPLDVPYNLTVVGYGTLATFLAVEMAGAWYALTSGRRRAQRSREERVQANRRLLDTLDGGGPRPTEARRTTT